MKVSLCMIVRNEIAHLETCLDSVEELVDEIVIVDTGSTDGTLDVVRARSDVWDQIEWSGFADARNHAQSLATGDIILILDADEKIVDTTGWKNALKAFEEGCDGVAVVVHNILPKEQILAGDRIWQLRMFGNRPELKWIGKVHNQIAHALQANPLNGEESKFFQARILIEHRGYDLPKDILIEKYKNRMKELAEEVAAATDPKGKAYYQFQTANALFMQQQYDSSLQFFRDCDLKNMTDENIASASIMAIHCCHILGVPKEAMEYSKMLLDVNPEEAMSFLMLGLCYLADGRFQAAYNFIGSAMAMTQLKDMEYKYLLDSNYMAAPCGEAALNLNRLEDAKALFQMHLEKYPTEKIALLEASIIPVDQARAQGYLPVNGQKVPGGIPQASPEETVSIRDVRTSDLQEQSEQNPSDAPAPISYQQ
ncbi:MAG: glycosyltransferase family 2 protein [Planctomycetes bacterium]|nr:glycosyltransferase family 2 protein [Planctomycetota bacterium]